MRKACAAECAVLLWRVVRDLYIQTGMNYDKHQINVVVPAALNTDSYSSIMLDLKSMLKPVLLRIEQFCQK